MFSIRSTLHMYQLYCRIYSWNVIALMLYLASVSSNLGAEHKFFVLVITDLLQAIESLEHIHCLECSAYTMWDHGARKEQETLLNSIHPPHPVA